MTQTEGYNNLAGYVGYVPVFITVYNFIMFYIFIFVYIAVKCKLTFIIVLILAFWATKVLYNMYSMCSHLLGY